MNKTYTYIGLAALVALIILGFGISEIVILINGQKYVSRSTECAQFPNITSFTAEKNLWSQWHWTYSFVEFNGKIEQNCPTTQHDTNVYVDGNLVARSDGKIFSFVTLTYINDCQGDRTFVTRTGDEWEAFINGNRIWVSFLLTDATEDETLAYVSSTSFFDDNIDIKDSNGQVVANMQRQFFEIPWKWKFTIYNSTHPGADHRVLSLIAGRRSFIGKKDTDTDACNNYFYIVGWLLVAILILITLLTGAFIYYSYRDADCFKRCKEWTHSDQTDNV